MYLDTKNPRFDIKMELLCTLSMTVPQPLKDLKRDLGLRRVDQVTGYINGLRLNGHVIDVTTSGKGRRYASLSIMTPVATLIKCREYWAAVNGGEVVAA